MMTRKCSQCGVEKEVCSDNFHKDIRCKDGFTASCKGCRNKQKVGYSKQRLDKQRSLGIKEHLEQYQRHKDRITAYHKRPDVVEKRKERIRAKYAANPEHYNAPKREYEKLNKERFKETHCVVI